MQRETPGAGGSEMVKRRARIEGGCAKGNRRDQRGWVWKDEKGRDDQEGDQRRWGMELEVWQLGVCR